MNTLQKLHSHHKAPVITIVSAVIFLTTLTSLQFLKPNLDPKWHVISEYEIGSYGWMMQIAFVFLALSCFGVFISMRSLTQVRVNRVGITLLLLAGIGAAIASIFTSQPITTTHYATHGILHLVGSAFFVPAIPIGATLIARSLLRSHAWKPARRILVWSTALLWAGLLSMGVTVATTFRGSFGSNVPVGWPNRYLILVYCVWMILLSWQVLRRASDRTY